MVVQLVVVAPPLTNVLQKLWVLVVKYVEAVVVGVQVTVC